MKESESARGRNEEIWSFEPLRKELRHRPLVLAFLGLAAGLSAGFNLLNPAYLILLLPVLRDRRSWMIVTLFAVLGFLLKPTVQPQILVPGGVFDGTAKVISVPQDIRETVRVIVETPERRYRLVLPASSDINLGDVVRLRAAIAPLPTGAVPQRLETAVLRPQGPLHVLSRGAEVWKWATRARQRFLAFVEAHCDASVTGVVQALTFNVTADIGDDTYERLKKTGTIHIVSASGMHVAIVSIVLAWLLLRTPLPRWGQLSVLLLALFFYAVAAGFNPPMIRAVLTMTVASSAYLFSREPDGLSALALAGVCTVLYEPEAVGNVGFLLSYLSVAALIAFAREPRQTATLKGAGLELVRTTFRASLVAWIATAPIVASEMRQLSLVSLVTNALIFPLLPAVVAGSLAAWGTSVLLPASLGILKLVAEPAAKWIYSVVDVMGAWPWASIATPHLPSWSLVLAYAMLACLYRPKLRPAEALTVW